MISGLGEESKAYDTLHKSLTKISDATSKNASADKALQKQKDKLIEMITNKYNKAIDEARKKLEALTQKLDDLKSATDDAINGAFNFGNALSVATEEAAKHNDAVKEAQQAHDDYATSVKDSIMSAFSLSDAFSKQQTAAQDLVKANEDLGKAQEVADAAQQKFNDAIDKYSSAAGRKARRDAYEEIQKAAADLVKPQEDLAAATLKANTAQAQQISFLDQLRAQADQAKGFAGKIQELMGLGLSKEGIDQIIQAGAVTGSAMADELIKGGSVAIAETNVLFKEIADVSEKAGISLADSFKKIGDKVGVDFIAALVAQSKNAKAFAEQVKLLVAAGFSPGAIQQVLSAGVEAGTQIAKALLDGGAAAVSTSTEIETSLAATANGLKTLLGATFYDAGIALAQRIVDGLEAKLAELKDLMPNMSIPELEKILTETPATIAAITSVVPTAQEYAPGTTAADVMKGFPELAGSMLTPEMRQSMDDFWSGISANSIGGFVGVHAKGGITKAPQIGMIGEAGPELIMPLNQFQAQYGNNSGGGQPINIVVNAGMGADGASIGDAIVNELIRYQRRNGKIPVKTL